FFRSPAGMTSLGKGSRQGACVIQSWRLPANALMRPPIDGAPLAQSCHPQRRIYTAAFYPFRISIANVTFKVFTLCCMPREYATYILTNWNKSVLYTGVTNNLPIRLVEHYIGKDN